MLPVVETAGPWELLIVSRARGSRESFWTRVTSHLGMSIQMRQTHPGSSVAGAILRLETSKWKDLGKKSLNLRSPRAGVRHTWLSYRVL